MVAHSQFCQAGDNTLESAEIAIRNILDDSGSEGQCLRLVFTHCNTNNLAPDTSSFYRMQISKDMELKQPTFVESW
jgi:hypothetical protein